MADNVSKVHQASPHQAGVLLLLQVPRSNDKKELAAEQLLASLYGLLTIPARGLYKTTLRERISFEITVVNKRIGFYVWVPQYLQSFIEEQLYAQYPTVQISAVADYASTAHRTYATTLITELKLTASEVLPIKTFPGFEADSLTTIMTALSELNETEEAWLQLVIRPAASYWHRKSARYITKLKGNKTGMSGLMSVLWKPPTHSTTTEPAEQARVRISGAEEKSHKLAFETHLRLVYHGHGTDAEARTKLQALVNSYQQFNATHLNGFAPKRIAADPYLLALYRGRIFNRGGFIANIEEIVTLYHLPHSTVETSHILWASAHAIEPPTNLPTMGAEYRPDLSPVATTSVQGHNTMFGLPRTDRNRHVYCIGQAGVGKSGVLELLAISDIYSPYGFAIIDPRGDAARNVLRRIPAERIQDVVYFNTADVDFPMAFNPLEATDPKLKAQTALELRTALKRLFTNWNLQLEHILHFSLLALLDYPQATMLDITRLLSDSTFRAEVTRHIQDSQLRRFWRDDFTDWSQKFMAQAITPTIEAVSDFTTQTAVQNIIGQPVSSFNIRYIMDQRKILVANLSPESLGEANAALLGALLVAKIQLAALSRADMPAETRTPFYLYIDGFEKLDTGSFIDYLPEARTYGLNVTAASESLVYMSAAHRKALLSTVGSIMAFRVSNEDAQSIGHSFEPAFEAYDLTHTHDRHFVMSMTISGTKTPAFSAMTLNLPPEQIDYSTTIMDSCRAKYAASKEYVTRYIAERYQVGPNAPNVIHADEPKVVAPVTAAQPKRRRRPVTAKKSPIKTTVKAKLAKSTTVVTKKLVTKKAAPKKTTTKAATKAPARSSSRKTTTRAT